MTHTEKLTLYRDQLAAAKSFKEYRAVHMAWVELLIAQQEADDAKERAMLRWVATVQPQTKIEIKTGEQHERNSE